MGREIKRCGSCQKEEPEVSFYARSNNCKTCCGKAASARAALNPGARRDASRRHAVRIRQSRKAAVLQHYGPSCICCGERDERFLSIDHIEGGGRAHVASLPSKNLHAWLIKHRYPEGFQALCFNCNLGRQVNGGICPHRDPERTWATERDRAARTTPRGRTKLTVSDVEEIRRLYKPGTRSGDCSSSALARRFGVHKNTIKSIGSGER